MSSVLVTGAGGFIGRRVVDCADGATHRVVPVSRRPAGGQSMVLDLTGPLGALPKVDWVFHLAGSYAGAGTRQLEQSDLEMTRRLIAWGRSVHVRNWVFASAAEVYGECAEPATEDSPTHPLIPYGRVKLEIEHLFSKLAREVPDTRAAILRIGEVYGRSGNLVEELTRRFSSGFCPWFGSGKVPVSFVHVDDVAQAFWSALRNAPLGISTWNIADDRIVTWREFLGHFARLLGTRDVVGLPISLSKAYALASTMADRVRGRRPTVTRYVVTLLTTPKPMSGRKAREQLGLRLQYPEYQVGLEEALD
ncbi:MAG: NAD-dependent epimerase/dehydratase family protein [Gemmatimonadota bacterium]|nr:MAG: NAD-dependent epimerase/dehydratase family protein [Gemmatimonadota bacterium]